MLHKYSPINDSTLLVRRQVLYGDSTYKDINIIIIMRHIVFAFVVKLLKQLLHPPVSLLYVSALCFYCFGVFWSSLPGQFCNSTVSEV